MPPSIKSTLSLQRPFLALDASLTDKSCAPRRLQIYVQRQSHSSRTSCQAWPEQPGQSLAVSTDLICDCGAYDSLEKRKRGDLRSAAVEYGLAKVDETSRATVKKQVEQAFKASATLDIADTGRTPYAIRLV